MRTHAKEPTAKASTVVDMARDIVVLARYPVASVHGHLLYIALQRARSRFRGRSDGKGNGLSESAIALLVAIYVRATNAVCAYLSDAHVIG